MAISSTSTPSEVTDFAKSCDLLDLLRLSEYEIEFGPNLSAALNVSPNLAESVYWLCNGLALMIKAASLSYRRA